MHGARRRCARESCGKARETHQRAAHHCHTSRDWDRPLVAAYAIAGAVQNSRGAGTDWCRAQAPQDHQRRHSGGVLLPLVTVEMTVMRLQLQRRQPRVQALCASAEPPQLAAAVASNVLLRRQGGQVEPTGRARGIFVSSTPADESVSSLKVGRDVSLHDGLRLREPSGPCASTACRHRSTTSGIPFPAEGQGAYVSKSRVCRAVSCFFESSLPEHIPGVSPTCKAR